jgi:hypothetical protein
MSTSSLSNVGCIQLKMAHWKSLLESYCSEVIARQPRCSQRSNTTPLPRSRAMAEIFAPWKIQECLVTMTMTMTMRGAPVSIRKILTTNEHNIYFNFLKVKKEVHFSHFR